MDTGLDAWQVIDCMWQGHDKLLSLRGGLVSAPVCSCTMGQAEDSMQYWWFLLWNKTKALGICQELSLLTEMTCSQRLWTSCLVLYLWALAKAWRNFMFCIAHLCKNRNPSNCSFSKFLSNTEVCCTVLVPIYRIKDLCMDSRPPTILVIFQWLQCFKLAHTFKETTEITNFTQKNWMSPPSPCQKWDFWLLKKVCWIPGGKCKQILKHVQ